MWCEAAGSRGDYNGYEGTTECGLLPTVHWTAVILGIPRSLSCTESEMSIITQTCQLGFAWRV